jgi:hypothetical protein
MGVFFLFWVVLKKQEQQKKKKWNEYIGWRLEVGEGGSFWTVFRFFNLL